MLILKVVFALALSIVTYTYLGYGIVLWLLVKIRPFHSNSAQ